MNGYFQLEIRSGGVYMKFIPPTEGAENCSMSDVTTYLDSHNIVGYNTVEIKRFLDHKMKTELFLSTVKMLPSGEEVLIQLSEDKMTAVAKFFPPFVGSALMNKEEIINALEEQGVTMGIKEDAIEAFIENREYCTPITIAKGEQPQQGKDAEIQYLFDTELRAKPQLNEDGSVDFHKLNSISHIKAGDTLAVLVREVKGKPGFTVTGAPIPAREVKKKKFNFGKNITLSKDRLSLISNVDGHVSLVDGKVFVSDTYTVLTDVDAGTGDIEYNGNIEVRGCVRSGFMLKADGNISVNGVVEGATLIAEGDIVLQCGIQGMGKGVLIAKGNIVTKFIENAQVHSGGNITAEAILHSTVNAKDSVVVTGKKGFITGGRVSALLNVSAKTIGSGMGSETVISVGIDPEEKDRIQECQKEINRLEKEIDRLEPTVKMLTQALTKGEKLSPEKLKQMRLLVGEYRENKQRRADYEAEMMELLEKEVGEKEAKVCVYGKIYPGVKIVISESRYVVREAIQYCMFRKIGMDVKMMGM